MKNKFTLIIIGCLVIGIALAYLSTFIHGGINLAFGWSGMNYLSRTGFPFAWQSECSVQNTLSAPAGCVNGFNAMAFIFNTIIYTLILSVVAKLIFNNK